MAIDCRRNRGNALEVLDIWGDDDVHVLRSADHPPGVDG